MVDGANIFSAKKNLEIVDFLKIFFDVEDCAYFDKYIPYNKMQILSRIQENKRKFELEGIYTKSLLMECIFNIIEEKRELVSQNFGVLSSNVMFTYYMAQKYELLFQLTYILQYGNNTDSVSWQSLGMNKVAKYFDNFYQEMVRKLHQILRFRPSYS